MELDKIHNSSQKDFLESVYVLSHSKGTFSAYEKALSNKNKTGFCDFIKEKYNLDEFELVEKIKENSLDVYKILREFVVFLDLSGYKPSSIKSRLAAVKGYLRHLGIKIYSEDCRHSVRLPKNIMRKEEPLTKEMLLRLLRNSTPKLQTVILVAVASGMRIGEIVQLQIRDIDFEYKPTKIRIRAETTKTREERETFLTEEATNSLKDYLKRFFNWKEGERNENLKSQIIFGRTSLSSHKIKLDKNDKKDPFMKAENVLQKALYRQIRRIPDLSRDNENGRKVIHFHAFRKYFRTVVGNACGRDFAEALIGHKFYLSTYYNLSEAQKKELYLKAEPYLTISDLTKVEANLKDVMKKYDELETKYNNLMNRFDEISIKVLNK